MGYHTHTHTQRIFENLIHRKAYLFTEDAQYYFRSSLDLAQRKRQKITTHKPYFMRVQ